MEEPNKVVLGLWWAPAPRARPQTWDSAATLPVRGWEMSVGEFLRQDSMPWDTLRIPKWKLKPQTLGCLGIPHMGAQTPYPGMPYDSPHGSSDPVPGDALQFPTWELRCLGYTELPHTGAQPTIGPAQIWRRMGFTALCCKTVSHKERDNAHWQGNVRFHQGECNLTKYRLGWWKSSGHSGRCHPAGVIIALRSDLWWRRGHSKISWKRERKVRESFTAAGNSFTPFMLSF